jgi:hypothetical protein
MLNAGPALGILLDYSPRPLQDGRGGPSNPQRTTPARPAVRGAGAPLERIHRQLKQSFDPAGVFNRGRLYAGL